MSTCRFFKSLPGFGLRIPTGCMFHRKPLYVAIAQRKEDRQAQLKLQFAQRLAGIAGPSTPLFPGGYPPYYYTAQGVLPQVPSRPGLMFQPLGLRPGWRANTFPSPARPVGFQPSPIPVVSCNFSNLDVFCCHQFLHFVSAKPNYCF